MMERKDAGGVKTILADWHRSESLQSDASAYSIFRSQDRHYPWRRFLFVCIT
jgi:hypothetical protein